MLVRWMKSSAFDGFLVQLSVSQNASSEGMEGQDATIVDKIDSTTLRANSIILSRRDLSSKVKYISLVKDKLDFLLDLQPHCLCVCLINVLSSIDARMLTIRHHIYHEVLLVDNHCIVRAHHPVTICLAMQVDPLLESVIS
jgi:hypothetical protein